uniref:Uncharacterized protein n=1 Tax=Arundo donax TaxID=35708 RepID=A0A0A9FYV4_ARUDO
MKPRPQINQSPPSCGTHLRMNSTSLILLPSHCMLSACAIRLYVKVTHRN